MEGHPTYILNTAMKLTQTRCPISAVIPTYQRRDRLIETLNKIYECNPQPAEVIVFIDGADGLTESLLRKQTFANLKIITHRQRVGAGGGRTIGIKQASCAIVASFDDDAYPLESNYFDRLLALFKYFPNAAVIGATFQRQIESLPPEQCQVRWTSSFDSSGCAYRRDAFLQTKGYLPLLNGYGIQEVDLALQLRHLGWGILQSDWLQVGRSSGATQAQSSQLGSVGIANLLLLMYLRYPIRAWRIGVGQLIRQTCWALKRYQASEILIELFQSLALIWTHKSLRHCVSLRSLRSHLYLQQHPSLVVLPQLSQPIKRKTRLIKEKDKPVEQGEQQLLEG